MHKIGITLLILAAVIVFGTAIAHMSCIFLGPKCYSAQMAPPQLIESAKEGTYLAPIITILVSLIFFIWGLYALSGAKLIRRLPLLAFIIYSISALCIIRGILPLQLWLRYPDRVNDLAFYYGLGWLVTGLLYLLGYRIHRDIR